MQTKTKSRPSVGSTQTAGDKPNISNAAFTSPKTLYNNSCEMSTVPRMRTIRETAKLAGVAEYFVRRLCKSGEFTGYVKAGNKTLVNFDRFVDFLNGGDSV